MNGVYNFARDTYLSHLKEFWRPSSGHLVLLDWGSSKTLSTAKEALPLLQKEFEETVSIELILKKEEGDGWWEIVYRPDVH